MSCESGKIPYNGLCYTPSELVKVMTTKSANTATQPKTETETKKGFDWMAALAILAGAAPAVIAATKGEKPNPYANAGTENRSGLDCPV